MATKKPTPKPKATTKVPAKPKPKKFAYPTDPTKVKGFKFGKGTV